MPSKIINIVPVIPDLSVILLAAPDTKSSVYISIKQNEKVNSILGEVSLLHMKKLKTWERL